MTAATFSTHGQLTPLTQPTPAPDASLARIAAALEELVTVQRDTMASVHGLWEMAGEALEYRAKAQRIELLEWVGKHPRNTVRDLLAQLDKYAPEGSPDTFKKV